MSKQVATNPFFEMDFSKFADLSNFSKMATEFKGMEPLMAAQRRNIEAFTALSQTAYESMQSLMRRQADMARQTMEDTSSLFSAMMASPASPEEKMIRQAEVSKSVVEKCIANARDVSETLNRCNTQAMEVVSGRLNEGIEELRGIMRNRQQNAA